MAALRFNGGALPKGSASIFHQYVGFKKCSQVSPMKNVYFEFGSVRMEVNFSDFPGLGPLSRPRYGPTRAAR
jgi:hypothetical protein